MKSIFSRYCYIRSLPCSVCSRSFFLCFNWMCNISKPTCYSRTYRESAFRVGNGVFPGLVSLFITTETLDCFCNSARLVHFCQTITTAFPAPLPWFFSEEFEAVFLEITRFLQPGNPDASDLFCTILFRRGNGEFYGKCWIMVWQV